MPTYSGYSEQPTPRDGGAKSGGSSGRSNPAAASEYPMQWREVHVLPCEIRLRTRPLHLPLLLDKSARRESRGGQGGADVNAAKAGRGVADVDLVFRGGPKCPKTAGES